MQNTLVIFPRGPHFGKTFCVQSLHVAGDLLGVDALQYTSGKNSTAVDKQIIIKELFHFLLENCKNISIWKVRTQLFGLRVYSAPKDRTRHLDLWPDFLGSVVIPGFQRPTKLERFLSPKTVWVVGRRGSRKICAVLCSQKSQVWRFS